MILKKTIFSLMLSVSFELFSSALDFSLTSAAPCTDEFYQKLFSLAQKKFKNVDEFNHEPKVLEFKEYLSKFPETGDIILLNLCSRSLLKSKFHDNHDVYLVLIEHLCNNGANPNKIFDGQYNALYNVVFEYLINRNPLSTKNDLLDQCIIELLMSYGANPDLHRFLCTKHRWPTTRHLDQCFIAKMEQQVKKKSEALAVARLETILLDLGSLFNQR